MKNRIKAASFLAVAITLTWGIAFRGTSEAVVPGINELISVDSSNLQANNNSDGYVSTNGDGRFVAFSSSATNLVPGDTNGRKDVFVRDRLNGTTKRISISSLGVQGDGDSEHPAITYDGRYVVFDSLATNLVSGDTNNSRDVFMFDTQTDTASLVSVSQAGVIGSTFSNYPDVSADGRFVVFTSFSANLIPGVSLYGLGQQVFIKDMLTGGLQIVSRNSLTNDIGNSSSSIPRISCDGGVVSFDSAATNLVSGDANGQDDVFISSLGWSKNILTNVTINKSGSSSSNSISCNGNYVAFRSWNPSKESYEIFTYNRLTKQTDTIVAATQNNRNSESPDISDDGRFIAFRSELNLDPGYSYSYGGSNFFIYDKRDSSIQLINIDESSKASSGAASFQSISADGSFVAYQAFGEDTTYTSGRDLVPGDANGKNDVYTSKTGF